MRLGAVVAALAAALCASVLGAPTAKAADKRKAVTFMPTPIVSPHSGGAGLLLRF